MSVKQIKGRPAGIVYFHLPWRGQKSVELGYWLGKPFWGRGYMPEAAREMIRHGFEDLGMNTIWCGYFEGNQKSKRVQEKIGFVYHHTREKVSVPLMKEVRTEHRNIMTKERWMAEREKNCGKV